MLNNGEILACPICKARLILDKKHQEWICRTDKLAFPERDGVPIMLVEDARRLTEEELKR